jgi:putative hydrolase of the HAD superfamily
VNAPAVTATAPDASPLGCRLGDWSVAAREGVRAEPRRRGRGILLDLDDTLYAREEYVQSGLLAVARHVEERVGLPAVDAFRTLTAARREGHRGRELQALCDRHGLDRLTVDELVAVFRTHRPVLRLPRATAAVLARLRADGWLLAIVTNGLPPVQRAKVSALGLAPLVDHVIYAEELAPGGKPARGVFRAALQRMGLPARRCVVVGDDPRCDIGGGRAAGLRTVRLAAPGATVAPHDEADAVIDTLEALPRVVAYLLDMVTPDAA